MDTGQLLDDAGLITPQTLLVVTSQSGASGEVTELLDRHADGRLPHAALVGVCDDERSPLARAADLLGPLSSGAEATGRTRSYLNSLAVHRLLRAAFSGEDLAYASSTELDDAAPATQDVLDHVDLATFDAGAAHHPSRRLGSVDDSCDNAEAESLIELYPTGCTRPGRAGGSASTTSS